MSQCRVMLNSSCTIVDCVFGLMFHAAAADITRASQGSPDTKRTHGAGG